MDIKGNRKLIVVSLALVAFTIIALAKNYDLLSVGTSITMITGTFMAGNSFVHAKGKAENEKL